MVGITHNGQKSLMFIVVSKPRKQLKVLCTTYGRNFVEIKAVIMMIITKKMIMIKIILGKTITIAI